MQINPASAQPQRINEMLTPQTTKVAGERENDGDADDGAKGAARILAANQMKPQGVGTKVDTFA